MKMQDRDIRVKPWNHTNVEPDGSIYDEDGELIKKVMVKPGLMAATKDEEPMVGINFGYDPASKVVLGVTLTFKSHAFMDEWLAHFAHTVFNAKLYDTYIKN